MSDPIIVISGIIRQQEMEELDDETAQNHAPGASWVDAHYAGLQLPTPT